MNLNKKLIIVLAFFLIFVILFLGQVILPKECFSFLPKGMRFISDSTGLSLERIIEMNKVLDVAEEIYETGTISNEEDQQIYDRITDYFNSVELSKEDYNELKRQWTDLLLTYLLAVLVFVVLIALFGGGIFLSIALPKRCKRCKKWFSVKKHRTYLFDETTTIFRTVIKTYKTEYKCEKCAKVVTVTERLELDV